MSANDPGGPVECVVRRHTLPIDVRGKWYEVPIAVQLHVVSLREQVRIATECPANAVRKALQRFIETTEDEGTTDLDRDVLSALVTFGYLTKRRAGQHGLYYELTDAGREVAEAGMTPNTGNEPRR